MVIFIREAIEIVKNEIMNELASSNEASEKKGLKYKRCYKKIT